MPLLRDWVACDPLLITDTPHPTVIHSALVMEERSLRRSRNHPADGSGGGGPDNYRIPDDVVPRQNQHYIPEKNPAIYFFHKDYAGARQSNRKKITFSGSPNDSIQDHDQNTWTLDYFNSTGDCDGCVHHIKYLNCVLYLCYFLTCVSN